VGSGPAGLACAQQLARAGHAVTLYEKSDRIGGLLRYGIPDFKLDKSVIDRRLEQMRAEGVEFRTSMCVGKEPPGRGVPNDATDMLAPERLRAEFDAVVLCGGAEQSRDLPIPGRELDGIHFAMEFLPLQNKRVAGDKNVQDLWASGKHVVIIGGGDTGSDCVGTANRHGAASVTNFELLPMPPDVERNPVWPYWPTRLRTSSSHEEGVERDWSVASKRFIGENGKVKALEAVRLEWKDGKPVEVPGSEFTLPAGLVLLAMGFVSPVQSLLTEFGVQKDARGNARATTDGAGCYATSVPKVFAAGDMRRGQSLVVWAIREGRQAARAVDEFLMGASELPR
jgi:glutamate synthase (NADPH/NADH) small chain